MRIKKSFLALGAALLLLAGAGAGAFGYWAMAGRAPQPAASGEAQTGQQASQQQKLDEIKALIDEKCLYGQAPENADDWIYTGLVAAVGDPYALYFPADQSSPYRQELSGAYYGMGANVNYNSQTGEVSFLHCDEGGPADLAGIAAGDLLLAADGAALENDAPVEALSLYLQEGAGSPVELQLYRPATGETFTTTVTPALLHTESVATRMLAGQTGYLRVTQFFGETAADFIAAVEELQAQGATGLVIDLRMNRGGALDSALEMADYLLADDLAENTRCLGHTTLTYTVDKAGNSSSYPAGDGHAVELPIVILLNRDSASASELFAGTLRDNGKAVLLGETSYGKGVGQGILDLSDGSAVKLTSFLYYTPSGFTPQDFGLVPDVAVARSLPFSEADNSITDASLDALSGDNQTQAALRVLDELRTGERTLRAVIGEGNQIVPPEGYLAQAAQTACAAAHFGLTLAQAQAQLPALPGGQRLFRQDDAWNAGEAVSDGTAEFEHEVFVSFWTPAEDGEMPGVSFGADPSDGRLHWLSTQDLAPGEAADILPALLKSTDGEALCQELEQALRGMGPQGGSYTGHGFTLTAEETDGVLMITVLAADS